MGYHQYSNAQAMTQPYMHHLPAPVQPPQLTQPQPGQSAPWTAEEDNTLMDAKSQGLGWNDIHQRYFPMKSGNACRKRHERLMQKLRTTDWDEDRIKRVMTEYNTVGVRERFWTVIATRVGEQRWEDVERVVCENLSTRKRTLTSH